MEVPRYYGAGLDEEKVPAYGSDEKRKASVVNEEVLAGDLYDERYNTTKRGLKSRHCQMIAIGGTIGTGLFVSTGETLATGGPALILIAYILMTITVYCIVTAITEVAAYLPVHGSTMTFYGYRYVSKSMGFAMGYLYWYSLGILVPYEITAAGLVIGFWHPPVNVGVWLTIMIIVIVGLNVLPVRFYGETEFWFASIKIFMMLGLLILSFILFWGGGPRHHGILAFRYWKDPQYGGAVHEYLTGGSAGRFVAFLATLVLAAFPFTFAPELIIATGGEMQSPRRNLPRASKLYFYRLIFFYVGCTLAIGVICPSNNINLTHGGAGAGSSAFVVGIKNAGIPILDSIINAGIVISAWSAGNSFLYLSSRSLYSLAITGNAPKIFKTCSKNGVPYPAVACSALFTLLSYLNCAKSSSVVFNWFVNLTNTSGFISWICCCIVYLRFRKACRAQNITDLPYHSWLQPYGAYVGIAFFTFLTLINGFTVFFPGKFTASSFLTAYIGIPIFLCIFFGHKIFWGLKDPWAHPPHLVDLKTGLQEVEEAEIPKRPYTKWYHYLRVAWE